MVTPSILLLLTLSLFFLHRTAALSATSISNAAEILSNSNFNSISLTLPFISSTLLSSLFSATLFTPSDSSFSTTTAVGQPSLSLLKFHFCPRFYSSADLLSLPSGSHLPTLLPNSSLTLTSSLFDDHLSLNGVNLNPSPVYDDGFFIVYQIDRFINPNLSSSSTPPSRSPECGELPTRSTNFLEASTVLRSRGYSLIASFLDLQLYNNNSSSDKAVTIFAPSDVSIRGYFGNNNSEWGSIFLRHVVGCELSWGDLIGELNDGLFVLPTFLDGFKINVTRNHNVNNNDSSAAGGAYSVMINGEVFVDSPEFYRNDGIVVHGLSGVLPVKSENNVAYSPVANNVADHIEF